MIRAIHKRLDEREEGFTLIELLVVVIIIGILAAIAIPAFLNQRQRAWAGSVESDLRNVAIQMETEFTENDVYPTTQADFTAAETAAGLPSDGVNLVLHTPAGPNDFCVQGTHANLAATEVYSYNSAAGGLQPVGTACPGAAAA